MTLQEQYQHLEDTIRSYNPAANFEQIRAAFDFAQTSHQGQLRKDGSPFVTHPLAVAQILAEELHLDSESIVAALLHDTIEDTAATHADIARMFSPTPTWGTRRISGSGDGSPNISSTTRRRTALPTRSKRRSAASGRGRPKAKSAPTR